jgi:hypothetical protein
MRSTDRLASLCREQKGEGKDAEPSGSRANFLPKEFPMADRNDERSERNYAREAGPQPDPALKEGPASGTRTWIVTGVIAAALLAVMYGITAQREVRNDEPPITTGSNQTPNQTGGRTTGNAPANPAVTTPAPKSGG